MDRLDAVLQELRSTAVPPDVPPAARSRSIPKPIRLGVPALLLGVALALVAFHRTPTEQAVVTAAPKGQWQRIMERIDADRMQAFMDDDVAFLALADEWHSPANRTDIAIMTDLRARGLRLDRNPMHIDAVSEDYLALAGDLKRAGLLVTDHVEAHNYVNGSGVVVASRPPRAQRSWSVELRRSAGTGRWRLFSAVPAPRRSVPSRHRGN